MARTAPQRSDGFADAPFQLQTITTMSTRGPMVGGSISTPHVRVDVEHIALVKPRPVGGVPPTPDPL